MPPSGSASTPPMPVPTTGGTFTTGWQQAKHRALTARRHIERGFCAAGSAHDVAGLVHDDLPRRAHRPDAAATGASSQSVPPISAARCRLCLHRPLTAPSKRAASKAGIALFQPYGTSSPVPAREGRRMMRLGWMITTCIAALAFGGSMLLEPAPLLIWNASASVPIGLYAVHSLGMLNRGDLVLVRPPQAIASFLQQRGYLAMGVPILKQVLALPGQAVCRSGRTIIVDEITVGDALDRDRRGRSLPVWQGCQIVADGEVFLMNRQSENSFDGRYFGLLPASTIVGRLTPLWIEKD